MPTGISYVDETWNPVCGCTKCSPGCLNCYAEKMAIRLNGIFAARGDDDNWAKMSNVLKWDYSQPEKYEFGKATGWNGQVELFHNRLEIPLHWRKPRRILVPSMGDLFHEKVPFEFIDKVMQIISCWPQIHTFLILTKRPKRMAEYFQQLYAGLTKFHKGKKFQWPFRNVHLGVTICNQKEADEKIPILLQIPAAHRWISAEPLLGEIDLHLSDSRTDIIWRRTHGGCYERKFLNRIVVGAESGPKRRPCKLEDIRSIVQQCKAAGVGCFVKQMPISSPYWPAGVNPKEQTKEWVSHDPAEWPKWARVRDEI